MSNKKKYGQYFTNPLIADFMVNLGFSNNIKDFLDPAVGPGIFVEYINKKNKEINIDAYEIDPKMIIEFKKKIKFDVNLLNCDYLYSDDKKYDLIVCNPPYNKFQEIPDRLKLIEIFEEKYKIKLSGYTNYCIYFLIKSLNSLKKNGKAVFIIPYEFMNTGYGNKVKQYILDNKMLKIMIKFNNNLKIFDDAITTSCIMLFENKIHEEINFIEINKLDELNSILNNNYNLENAFKYNYININANQKWSTYFKKANKKYSSLIEFKNIAKVKRGIATGNNKYFSLNKTDIKKNKLSDNVCIKCVTKSPDIKELIMTEEYFNKLVLEDKKMFVFDGRKKTTPDDEKYIKYGEKIGANESYLNRHRNPWYGLEDKLPAPIWISVFSRRKIKIIRNEILINNLTNFHGIYMNNDYKEYVNILFCYLLTPVAQRLLYTNKREYGEGLDKFEPNDINNSMILDFRLITKEDKNIIEEIYKEYKKNKTINIEKLDKLFSKYIEECI